MLVSSGLAYFYWGFAVQYAVELENRFLPTRPDSNVTCQKAFHGVAPKNSIVKPFGYLAFLHVDVDCSPIKKLSDTSIACVFLGFAYHIGHKGYMLKQINKKRYFVAMRSVTFDKGLFPYLKPIHPEDAKWAPAGQETEQPELSFEALDAINENDELEQPPEPSDVEVVLEDLDEEPAAAEPSVVPDDEVRTIQTRSMKRAWSKGDSDRRRGCSSTAS